MRTLHLFHMSYGIAGLASSVTLNRTDGIVISFWMLLLGALPFLNPWPPILPRLRRMMRR